MIHAAVRAVRRHSGSTQPTTNRAERGDLLTTLLEDSALVDLGHADAEQLRLGQQSASSDADTSLFAFLRLELGLRGLLT